MNRPGATRKRAFPPLLFFLCADQGSLIRRYKHQRSTQREVSGYLPPHRDMLSCSRESFGSSRRLARRRLE
jgi:hypothetical protein